MNALRKTIHLLPTVILLSILIACTTARTTSTQTGRIVPASEFSKLADKYNHEIDARHNEIEVRIELPKTTYAPNEAIAFNVVLINESNTDVIVRKPDSQTNRVDTDPNSRDELVFVVIPDNSMIPLTFPAPVALYPGAASIPPKDFVLLPPGQGYTATIAMPHPLHPMSVGRYSAQLKYSNYRFDASAPGDSGNFFLDFHAWMGEITSNTVTFESVPYTSSPK